jgi:hypothetical protein
MYKNKPTSHFPAIKPNQQSVAVNKTICEARHIPGFGNIVLRN